MTENITDPNSAWMCGARIQKALEGMMEGTLTADKYNLVIAAGGRLTAEVEAIFSVVSSDTPLLSPPSAKILPFRRVS